MGSAASVVFYLVAFSFAALLMYYGTKRNNKIIIGMSLLIPIMVGSLRYNVGTDYFTYVSIYNDTSNLSIADLFHGLSQVEPGFLLLVKLSQFITGNPIFLFAASSFLTILFFYLGLRRYKINHPALVYLLFLLVIFPITFNIVRQGIAMSMCFYALSFMVERRPKMYFLWVFIASLFHMTALFLLPVYFLGKLIKDNKNNSYLLFVIKLIILSLIVFLSLPYIFGLIISTPFFEKYNIYQTVIGEGSNYTLYLQFGLLVLIVLSSKWAMAKKNMGVFLFFLMFAVLELVLNTLGFTSTFIKRVSLYFSFFSLILLTNFVDIFSDKLGKFIAYSLIVLYGIAYFYLAYYQLGQADVIPYHILTGGSI